MADKSVFTRLRRLFSTDVVIRNVGGNQIKTIDSGHIQSSGEYETNALVDRFNKVYSSAPTSLYGAQFNLNYQYLRTQLYSEYDVMDTDAIIASSLDIIADESTLKNDMGEVLQIRSSNEDIQKILYNLFYDVLNVEFNLWMWVRQMCKYGDFFLKLEIAEKYGVYNVIPYTAFHIERMEGDNENPSEVKFRFDPEGVSASDYGIESLVYLPAISDQGLDNEDEGFYRDRSVVDHIYFSQNPDTTNDHCSIQNMIYLPEDWFRLDNDHMDDYELTGLSSSNC